MKKTKILKSQNRWNVTLWKQVQCKRNRILGTEIPLLGESAN
jgi:hypothetical protein